MTENRLVLSGIVCKTPICKCSPSGIAYFQCLIEHHSMQQEAGFLRQSWCRLPIVVSGKKSVDLVHSIMVGVKIIVKGFISSHKGFNGLNKIVLHADYINLIDSGDSSNDTLFSSS